jgi:predicted nuclease with TOPRIM domain
MGNIYGKIMDDHEIERIADLVIRRLNHEISSEIKSLRERVASLETSNSYIREKITHIMERINSLDNRVWMILTSVLIGILINILLRLL